MKNKYPCLDEKTLQEIKSDPISLENAGCLAHIYLELAKKQIKGFSIIECFGGYFKASELKLEDSHVGIRFWYCLKNDDSANPEFFLALERVKKYEKDFPEDINDMAGRLSVPKLIKYKGNGSERSAVESELKSDLYKQARGRHRTIRKLKILEYSANFRNFINQHSSGEGVVNDPYLKYVIAYFENNPSYKAFMDQNPVYVGYFMGYANHPDFFPNYLRPILAGVDAQGKIIGIERENPKGMTGGKLLQHSWPPPPPVQRSETDQ